MKTIKKYLFITLIVLFGQNNVVNARWRDVDLANTSFDRIAEYVKDTHYVKPSMDEYKGAIHKHIEGYYTKHEKYEKKIRAYNRRKNKDENVLDILRVAHGGIHAIRTSFLVEYFAAFYEKYGFRKLSDEEKRMMRYIALFHDAGRKGDGIDKPEWEIDGAKLCEEFLTDNKTDEQIAEKFSSFIPAIDKLERNFYQSLLRTADSFDIIRIRGYNVKEGRKDWFRPFDVYYPQPCQSNRGKLEGYITQFKEQNAAIGELEVFTREYRKMLAHQGDISYASTINRTEKKRLEKLISKYEIPKITWDEYVEQDHYFQNYMDRVTDPEDVAFLKEVDKSFSFDKKVAYELSDNCYKKMLHDFAQLPSVNKMKKHFSQDFQKELLEIQN